MCLMRPSLMMEILIMPDHCILSVATNVSLYSIFYTAISLTNGKSNDEISFRQLYGLPKIRKFSN